MIFKKMPMVVYILALPILTFTASWIFMSLSLLLLGFLALFISWAVGMATDLGCGSVLVSAENAFATLKKAYLKANKSYEESKNYENTFKNPY